jgi:hypothetical protein
MAKQKSFITLEGTIGGITFYKSQDGYLAREKGGVSGDRIATDPSFQRTRENGSEFGRAGKAGKVLRNSVRTLLQNSADSRMVGRLTQKMVEVIQEDATSLRGERNVLDGELELLEGFEFNINSKLGSTLYVPYTASINRVAGTTSLTIPSFIPINSLAAPGGTTHYKIVAAGAEVDFENETFVASFQDSGIMPWDITSTASLNMESTLTANSIHPIFMVLGVEFYQDVNGQKYSLKNGAYNPLSIVKVSGL